MSVEQIRKNFEKAQFAAVLQELLLERQWTMHDLRKAVTGSDGKSKTQGSYLYRILRGTSRPAAKTVHKIAQALELDPKELIARVRSHKFTSPPRLSRNELVAMPRPSKMEVVPGPEAKAFSFHLDTATEPNQVRVTINLRQTMSTSEAIGLLSAISQLIQREKPEGV